MKNEIRIKMSSYDHTLLDSTVKRFIALAKTNNFTVKGPIPLPTKREIFTFCRSPHVDKPAMEQFQRLSHKRLIILNGDESNIENLKQIGIPSGVSLQIKN